MVLNFPVSTMFAQGAFCCESFGCDPCELTFSQKQTLFESRPISAAVVVNAGDIDLDTVDEEDVADLRRDVRDLIEERAVLMNQLLAKDDDIARLEASLGDIQSKLFDKTGERALPFPAAAR